MGIYFNNYYSEKSINIFFFILIVVILILSSKVWREGWGRTDQSNSLILLERYLRSKVLSSQYGLKVE